jgi:L-ascorbate metabolism protein UlaG (beta-lactamase superfamily)
VVTADYLRPDVAVEPLIFDWYAWPYLIPPASAAAYIAFRHVPVLESFLANPQRHQKLLQFPEMRGGPFVDTDPANVGAVRALLERTRSRYAHMIELADAVRELEIILETEARGGSLEPLYARVPAPLRGLVELGYDVRNHASLRLLEPLLYRSRYWDPSAQSIRFLPLATDERSFVFSTPHLGTDARYAAALAVPFASPDLDALFRMRRQPGARGEIIERLRADAATAGALDAMFTPEPPRRPPTYDGADVRVRYLGHACVLFESRACNVLFDPIVAYETQDAAADRFTHVDLPDRIDYVVLTHNHQDHCMLETLLALRHSIRHVVIPRGVGGSLVDPSLRLLLQHVGFTSVLELEPLDAIAFDGGELRAVPFLGEHCDLDIRTKSSYHLRFGDRSALLVADSNTLEPRVFEHLRDVIGPVDLLFLGMECDGAPLNWLYAPFLPAALPREQDQSRRLNASDYAAARAIIDLVRPARVRVYAMGLEPWLGYVTSIRYTAKSRPMVESDRLLASLRDAGIDVARSFMKEELAL